MYKKSKTELIITCPLHGDFEQTPNNHLSGRGCSVCKSSKGEKRIIKYLKDKKILFNTQKTFKNLKYKSLLKFDFYLPDYNLCIEYDGRQHYEPIEYFGGRKQFDIIKMRDSIKNEYCSTNNINLVRIPYNKFDDIETILGKNI